MKDSQWWDKSITLVEGCKPVSEGCAHCWSAGMAHRFRPELTTDGHFNGKVICREDRLDEIIRRKKPTKWTIWNDLFHPSVPFEFIDKVIAIIHMCSQHTFQVLTKRPKRMYAFYKAYHQRAVEIGIRDVPKNVWLGVTAENQPMADKRIPILLQIPAAVRFVSIEPMLEAVDSKLIEGHTIKTTRLENSKPCYRNLDTGGRLSWIIVGCESGPKRRECKIEWVRDIVRQCQAAGVPVFVKQLSLKGKVCKDINQFPKDLQIREYPKGR